MQKPPPSLIELEIFPAAQPPPPTVAASSPVPKRSCTCSPSCQSDVHRIYRIVANACFSSQTMMVLCVIVFLAAWFIFIGGAVWSNTYYHEYYCKNRADSATPRPDPHDMPSRSYADGHPLLPKYMRDDVACMPSKPIRRYFPMKVSYYIPGIMLTIAFCCMMAYTFRPYRTGVDLERNAATCCDDVDDDECMSFMRCCKQSVLICTVCWGTIGLFIALIFVVMMMSFVEVMVHDQQHVMVPALSVLIQCMLLVLATMFGFLAKWLGYRESIGHVCCEDAETSHVY